MRAPTKAAARTSAETTRMGRRSRRLVAVEPTAVRVDTKLRLLDTAEDLFMKSGYEATSLRQITSSAGVNLAAVNYHFGSKEELFQAVLTRRLDPMNQQRIALLDRMEQAAKPAVPSCEQVMSAMILPALEISRDPGRGGANFLRLLGRAYADPAPFIRHFLSAQYAEMIARFKAAFALALPQIPRQELSWRLHFVMGALSYTLAGTDALKLIAQMNPVRGDKNPARGDNDELLLARLAPFLVAGLRAPVPELPDVKASRRPK